MLHLKHARSCDKCIHYAVFVFFSQLNKTTANEIKQFETTAGKLLILFDDGLKYHPQYADFNLTGECSKQSSKSEQLLLVLSNSLES